MDIILILKMANPILNFRENVIREAKEQALCRQAHQPIPAAFKKYARLLGLFIWLICGFGSLSIFLIGWLSGSYYIFFILLCGTLSLIGFIQMLTGRQFLNRGK